MTIVLSAAYLLSRPSNSYPDTLLSSSASNFVSAARVLRPRILRLASRVPSMRFQRRLNDQERVRIVDRMDPRAS